MKELILREEVEELLIDTSELTGYQFKILDEKLSNLKTRAILRDCDGCFGESFGDCDGCERIKVTE